VRPAWLALAPATCRGGRGAWGCEPRRRAKCWGVLCHDWFVPSIWMRQISVTCCVYFYCMMCWCHLCASAFAQAMAAAELAGQADCVHLLTSCYRQSRKAARHAADQAPQKRSLAKNHLRRAAGRQQTGRQAPERAARVRGAGCAGRRDLSLPIVSALAGRQAAERTAHGQGEQGGAATCSCQSTAHSLAGRLQSALRI